jgi:hypothetical protein
VLTPVGDQHLPTAESLRCSEGALRSLEEAEAAAEEAPKRGVLPPTAPPAESDPEVEVVLAAFWPPSPAPKHAAEPELESVSAARERRIMRVRRGA